MRASTHGRTHTSTRRAAGQAGRHHAGRLCYQPARHTRRQAGRQGLCKQEEYIGGTEVSCHCASPECQPGKPASRRLPQDVSAPCQSLPTSSRRFCASGVSCLVHGAPACFPVPPGVTLCDPLWHSPLREPVSSPDMHTRVTAA